jgi:hypothetical protein
MHKTVYIFSGDVERYLLMASEHWRVQPETTGPVCCCFLGSDTTIYDRNIQWAHPYTLMMALAGSPETSVNFCRSTRRHVPEDSNRRHGAMTR